MKNSRGFIQIILILVVLAAIAGVYYFGTKNKIALVPTPTPVVSVQPTPSPIVISTPNPVTANWKTYTNTAFGYSFKYPSDTEVNTYYVDKSVIPNPTPLEESGTVYFSLDSNNRIEVNISKENTILKESINYKLDNLDASRFLTDSRDFYDMVIVTKPPYDYMVYLIGEKDKYTTVFNEFLSTFKFTK